MTAVKVPKKNSIGAVLKDPNGTLWVVVNSGSYEAFAHNDRWVEHWVNLRQLSKRGPMRMTNRADNFRVENLYDWDVVGKATFEVKEVSFL